MTSIEEEFDLAPIIDEPMNSFKIVHIHNRSEIYHLTRQVLLDSTLTQNTNQIFYHTLTKSPDEFNTMYGSFACIIYRNNHESDLYLNVDSEALEHIIKYVQTSKLDGQAIYAKNWKTINEIIDLATMFGMPVLVSSMRLLHPSDEKIDNELQLLTEAVTGILRLYKYHVDEFFDIEESCIFVDEFIKENKKEITDSYIRPAMHNNSLVSKSLYLLLYVFLSTLTKNKIDPDTMEKQISNIDQNTCIDMINENINNNASNESSDDDTDEVFNEFNEFNESSDSFEEEHPNFIFSEEIEKIFSGKKISSNVTDGIGNLNTIFQTLMSGITSDH